MSQIKQRGFNMVEVLVTISITTVGLLGISSLQLQSNRATQDSGNRSQAVWMLEDLADRMNINASGLNYYATNGNYACPAAAPTICADYHDGNSRTEAANCSAQQIATFDLWDLVCQKNYVTNGTDVRSSSADFISNPVLNIQVNAEQRSAALRLTWDTRTSGTDANGNTVYIIDENNERRTATLVREVQL